MFLHVNSKLIQFFILICFLYKFSSCNNKNIEKLKFPANFSFGAATAAYQIEGGWNADGKGETIWDKFTHNHPEIILDKSNGDIAADSYHLFDEDLKIIKNLGLNFYRFSISWARILPTGDVSSLNQAGINYYNDIINKLLENNIQPMVTMFHYDLPAELQKIGGFTNPLFLRYFEKYAEILYQNYGDRVKHWITFNEPWCYCVIGYGKGIYPPQIHSEGVADYLCMDHTVKAHALAYRLYQNKYKDKFNGKIGIALSSVFYFSKTDDVALVDRAMQFLLGWLAHPIYSKSGGYPEVMIEEIAKNSLHENRAWSRLPVIEGEWKNLIRGSADFLGLNYYTSRYIEFDNKSTGNSASWERDSRIKVIIDPKWKTAKSNWLYIVPEGLEGILKYIRDEYDNVEVIITENGFSDDGQLDDDGRIDYLKQHLQAVLNAINSGCNVSAYTAWSLMDNFEWLLGYTEKFGMYSVNMSSPNRERTPKKSADFYKKVIKTHSLE